MPIYEGSYKYGARPSFKLFAPGREHDRILQTLAHLGPLHLAELADLVDDTAERVQEMLCDLAEQSRATPEGLEWRVGGGGCCRCPCYRTCPRLLAIGRETARRQRMRGEKLDAVVSL